MNKQQALRLAQEAANDSGNTYPAHPLLGPDEQWGYKLITQGTDWQLHFGTKIESLSGVAKVAMIVFLRGDCTMWGAEDETLEACTALVEEVQENGQSDIESGDTEFDSLQDLLQEELGLEPDYIMDLWPM